MAKIKGQQYPSIPADGRIKTAWVPAIADIYAPTLDEIEAGVDISCAITMGGFTFSPSQATISDQRECTDQDFGRPGRKSVSDASVQLIDNTNSEIEADWNYAVEALTEGSEGYFVRRRGLPASAPWANGQTVTVIPAETGEKQMVAQDENTPQRSTIPFFVTAEWSVENSLIGGVKTVPATGLTLDNDTVNVTIGEDATVTATPEPTHTTERLTATSNAEATATVTVKGTTITIHGVEAGTATVTVTLGTITKTVQVTVNAPIPTLGELTVTAAAIADGKSVLTVPEPDNGNMLRYKVTAADQLPEVEYDTVCATNDGWADIPADKAVPGTAGQVVTVVELTTQGAKARKKGQSAPLA